MANKPDERLIILLPPDLLEEVRRAAEAEDLSVSQIARRALRNELKAIAGRVDSDLGTTLEGLKRLLEAARRDGVLTGNGTPRRLGPRCSAREDQQN
jgi:Ribbon-helix-helix protein, copG family